MFAAVSMGFMAGNNSTSLMSGEEKSGTVDERRMGVLHTRRVREEHDKAVDADTPATGRRQTVLETKGERNTSVV